MMVVPGYNGARFAQKVIQFAPLVVRFILGGSRSVLALVSFRLVLAWAMLNFSRKWYKHIKRFHHVKRKLNRGICIRTELKKGRSFLGRRGRALSPQFKLTPFQTGLDFGFKASPTTVFRA